MKYGQREVLDLKVFDEDGNLITVLNTLKESALLSEYVFVKDALLDRNLLEFVGKVEPKQTNDFESHLGKSKFQTVITFNRRVDKKCKLIGSGILRQADTGKDVEFLFEIPKATITRGVEFQQNNVAASEFDLYFRMLPFNDDGDLYKMHI